MTPVVLESLLGYHPCSIGFLTSGHELVGGQCQVWNLAGFLLLHFLSRKKQYDGQIALGYCAWYGLGRAVIEGLRVDSLYWGSFRVSQVLAGITCLTASALLIWQHFRPHDPEKLMK